MDKERLYKAIGEETTELRRREKRERRAQLKKQLSSRARERHAAPFKALEERHSNALEQLGKLVEGGKTWKYNDGSANSKKQGIIVVLGEAPKSDVTPDHVAVCVAGIVDPDYFGARKYPSFKFAFIPRESLEEAIQAESYPLGNVANKQCVIRNEDFSSPEKFQALTNKHAYTDGIKNWMHHRQALSSATSEIEALEGNITWVTAAAVDPELNPHLQVSIESAQAS